MSGLTLHHGLVVIPYRQTKGQGRQPAVTLHVFYNLFSINFLMALFCLGRGKNVWLSPEGCAMFTLQLHIPLKSVLGERLSLIQHLTTVAIVSTVKNIPGYEVVHFEYFILNDNFLFLNNNIIIIFFFSLNRKLI